VSYKLSHSTWSYVNFNLNNFRQDSSVGVATKVCAEQHGSRGSILDRNKILSLLNSVHKATGALPTFSPMGTGCSSTGPKRPGRGVHLVPKLRMLVTIPQFPVTSALCDI
jgi:hypothetical protein